MLPIVASALVGIATRVGVGLIASVAKRAWDAARAQDARAEEFSRLLDDRRVRGGTPGGIERGRAALAPDDLAGRMAVERLTWSTVGDRARSVEAG